MRNYRDQLISINEKYFSGNTDLAWDLYTKLLEAENLAWKIPIAKDLAKHGHEQNLVVFLSIKFCDLVLVDFHQKQVFFASIALQKYAYGNNKAYMNWLEENRKIFSEDISDDFGYKTKVLLVLTTNDNSGLEDAGYYKDNYIITNFERLGLGQIAGGPNPFELTKENHDVLEYCRLCANELTDIVFTPPENNNNSVVRHSTMPKDFELNKYAPKSYIQFVNENRKAIRGLQFKEILQLSMHFVLLDIDRNILKDVITHFGMSIVHKHNPDNIEFFSVNAAAQSIDEFKKNLKEKRNSIIVIKNLDAPVNSRVSTYTKQEQLDILCYYMEQNNNNILVLPLSKQNWQEFVALNPMLRILFQHIFVFEPLSVGVLENYFLALLKNYNYTISKEARELCVDFFSFSKNNLPKTTFSYTLATVLFREACYYHAIRIAGNSEKNSFLQSPDIKAAIKDEYKPSYTESLSDVMADLNQLIGLENVKTSVSDLAALIKIDRIRNKINQKASISLNVLFTGNPGTGKTTVAQMLGRVYKSIGALKSGHLVAVGRQDIVGQFIGDTERNMKDIIAKAHGGVLFIDEAYSLYKDDSPRDFGIEAINVLVDSLEKIREHTCVILAGYPKPMSKFLTANEGLSSRFPHAIKFDDYNQHQLYSIFLAFMNREHLQIEIQAEVLLREYLDKINENRTKYFGNARECRNIFEKLKLAQARRLANVNTDVNDLYLIKKEDVESFLNELTESSAPPKRKQIGFATKKI
nr:AAA family ATPase [uncultured Draconibacterium sp.]